MPCTLNTQQSEQLQRFLGNKCLSDARNGCALKRINVTAYWMTALLPSVQTKLSVSWTFTA